MDCEFRGVRLRSLTTKFLVLLSIVSVFSIRAPLPGYAQSVPTNVSELLEFGTQTEKQEREALRLVANAIDQRGSIDDFRQVAPLMQRLDANIASLLGEDHPLRAYTLTEIAWVTITRDPDTNRTLAENLDFAITLLPASERTKNVVLLPTYIRGAQLHRSTANAEKSAQYRKTAAELEAIRSGAKSPRYALRVGDWGRSLLPLYRYEEAEILLRRSLELLQTNASDLSIEVWEAKVDLAWALGATEKYDERANLVRSVIASLSTMEPEIDSNSNARILRLENRILRDFSLSNDLGYSEEETVAALERSVKIVEHLDGPWIKPGAPKPNLIRPLTALANIAFTEGNTERAKTLLQQATANFDPGIIDPNLMTDAARSFEALAVIALYESDLQTAESLIETALQLTQRNLRGLNNPWSLDTLHALIYAKMGTLEFEEAYSLAERYLSLSLEYMEKSNHRSGPARAVGAMILVAQLTTVDNERAFELIERAETLAEKRLGQDHNFKQDILFQRARIYARLADRARAMDQLDRMFSEAPVSSHPNWLSALKLVQPYALRAELYAANKEYSKAASALEYARLIATSAGASKRVLEVDIRIASLFLQSEDFAYAKATAKQALKEVSQQISLSETSSLLGSAFETGSLGTQYEAVAAMIYIQAALSDPANALDDPFLFRAIQSYHSSSAARAFSFKHTQRLTPKLDQDLLDAWRQSIQRLLFLDRQIATSSIDGESGDELRATYLDEKIALNEKIISLERDIAATDPGFFDLIRKQSISEGDLKKELLRDDEALIILASGNDWLAKENATGFVYAVTKEKSAFAKVDLTQNELANAVSELHNQLTLGGGTRSPGQPSREYLEFDRESSFTLYKALFGDPEVNSVLSTKENWLIITQGEYSSLPFAALVTHPPTGSNTDPRALRETAWLGMEKSISLVPSISSLQIQRQSLRANSNSPRVPFIGIGDPAYSGSADGDAVCQGGRRNSNNYKAARFFEGDRVDRNQFSSLSRLPCSANEIQDLASMFGSEAKTLLQLNATEENIRQSGIEQAEILVFATHGLIAGDMLGTLAEPALALTPPVEIVNGKLDDGLNDGLLTATEVANLDLSAGWVILSACNTAAGGVVGSEGLSGLAKAFFYAGAESLMVSQFPIYDDAARELTTLAVSSNSRDFDFESLPPECRTISIGNRAGSLRLSMCALLHNEAMDNFGRSYAHPSAWAPFALIDAT